jgi:hypothetical protein
MMRRLISSLLIATPCCLAQAQTNLAPIAAVLPELKVIQPSGLPVRVAQEDWGGARTRVQADPGWTRWVEGRRKAVDQWISAVRDRSEWVGGDMHELLDPVTQVPLKWTVDLPMPAGSSDIARRSREAWVGWLRSANFRRIQEASRLYRLTGEEKYADWAAGQIDFYASNYAGWPLRDIAGQSRMMGQGLDEATACVPLLDAVRLLSDFAGEARIHRWRDKLFLPIGRQLLVSRHRDNIRLWQTVAVTLIGLQFDEQTLVMDGLDGPTGVRFMLKKGVTSDYFWYEGTLGYQTYVLRALAPLFTHASLLGRAPELYAEMLVAQNLMLTPLQFRFDDGMLPTPGDSSARLKAVDLGYYMEMYRTLPNRISLIEASGTKMWETLIDPVAFESDSPSRLPHVVSKNFDSIRMAVLKASGWQVFLRYGQLVLNHSQQDALSTEIYYDDTPVSVSPSTVAYGSPLHSEYFHRAISHNTALIDGEGQTGFDPGVVDSFTDIIPLIEVRQPKLTSETAAKRMIAIRDGAVIDRLSLKLNATALGNHRLGFLFHTDCSLISDAPGVATKPPTGTGFRFWEKVTVRQDANEWLGRLRCKELDFDVIFSMDNRGSIYAGKTPTKPLPEKRNSLYFEVIGREATMEMRLKPVR